MEAEARDSRETRETRDRTEDADEKERAELEDRVGEPLGEDGETRRTKRFEKRVGDAFQSLPEDERLSTGALDARGFAVDETRYLERFFRRLNKATLDALASNRERERLSAENADLRDIVAGYLNGVTVSEETTRDPNMFVVNERVLKAQAQRRDAEAKAEAARNDEQRLGESAARKLYNSRRAGARSGGERERARRRAGGGFRQRQPMIATTRDLFCFFETSEEEEEEDSFFIPCSALASLRSTVNGSLPSSRPCLALYERAPPEKAPLRGGRFGRRNVRAGGSRPRATPSLAESVFALVDLGASRGSTSGERRSAAVPAASSTAKPHARAMAAAAAVARVRPRGSAERRTKAIFFLGDFRKSSFADATNRRLDAASPSRRQRNRSTSVLFQVALATRSA